jgi:hypothetical protein
MTGKATAPQERTLALREALSIVFGLPWRWQHRFIAVRMRHREGQVEK